MFPAPHCHLQSPGRVPFLPPGEAGASGLRADSRPSGTCSLSPLQIVLENSSREDKHECPFGRSSIELTRMLCDILKVGELPSETCNDFHPMFFTHDRSFEEFFCICIQLLNKTWKEMRATSEDFNKVKRVRSIFSWPRGSLALTWSLRSGGKRLPGCEREDGCGFRWR